MLTSGQEAFVAAILEGKSQRQAYYTAYPKSKKWKPSAVDSQASILAKNPKVSQRIDELKAKVEAQVIAKGVWSREQAQNTLLWLIDTAKKQTDAYQELTSPAVSAIMGAVKELNALAGIKVGDGADEEVKIIDDL